MPRAVATMRGAAPSPAAMQQSSERQSPEIPAAPALVDASAEEGRHKDLPEARPPSPPVGKGGKGEP